MMRNDKPAHWVSKFGVSFWCGSGGTLLIVSQCGIHTQGASKLGAYEVFLLFAPLLIIAVSFSTVCGLRFLSLGLLYCFPLFLIFQFFLVSVLSREG